MATDNGGRSTTSETLGVTVGATISTSQLHPTDDGTLRESAPTAVSNWREVEAYGKPGAQNVALLKFDVSASKGTGHEVRSAILKMYAAQTKNLPGTFAVHSTTGSADWSENSVNWQNGPKKVSTPLATAAVDEKGTWIEFDVTSYVANHVADSSLSSSITFWVSEASGLTYKLVKFTSGRASNTNKSRPTLTYINHESTPILYP